MITENTHKQKVRGNERYGLQINPFKDSNNFNTFICLLDILFFNAFNIFSLHRQHLLSLSFCGRKIGVV